MAQTSIFAAIGRFPQDDAVLTRAVEVASRNGAALTVIHIVDLPGFEGDLGARDTLHGQTALAMRDRIETALVRLGKDPSGTQIRIEAGTAALKLIEICERSRPDLVVMRAHLKTKVVERILGSTTDRMIAAGIAPVLVIKRAPARRYAHALLATNGTDGALAALSFVETLLPEVRLHLVQAVQIPPQLKEALLLTGNDQAALTAHRNALTGLAEGHLRALSANATRRVTWRVLKGDPATALVRATRSPVVDVIAVGPGRTNLIRRAFIGSVTRRLLRDATCDVLICHPDLTGAGSN